MYTQLSLTIIPPKTCMFAWTMAEDTAEPTYEELVERLANVTLSATARGANSMEASLLTWYRHLAVV